MKPRSWPFTSSGTSSPPSTGVRPLCPQGVSTDCRMQTSRLKQNYKKCSCMFPNPCPTELSRPPNPSLALCCDTPIPEGILLFCGNGTCLLHLADTVCAGGLGGTATLQAAALVALQVVSQSTRLRSCSQSLCMTGLLFCRTYILPEDLEHFLEPEKAQQAFDILDVDGDGQVTLHNIRDAVVTIYQVRKALVHASLMTHTSTLAMFLLPYASPDSTSVHASSEDFHIPSKPLQHHTNLTVSISLGWHSEQAIAVVHNCVCVNYDGMAFRAGCCNIVPM